MDVALPIVSVIPSLDGPVLAALAGSCAPMSLTEVHRLTDQGSLTGVRRVLLRLVDTGIVHGVPGGYILNREHVAAPAIEQLAGLHGALAERVRDTLEHWDGNVVLAGFFGSLARRDGDNSSDIDVLVVSDSAGLDDLADLLAERIERWTGNTAQVIARTTADVHRLRDKGERILDEWERDLLALVGDKRVLRGITV